jgi:hypothetical protein
MATSWYCRHLNANDPNSVPRGKTTFKLETPITHKIAPAPCLSGLMPLVLLQIDLSVTQYYPGLKYSRLPVMSAQQL